MTKPKPVQPAEPAADAEILRRYEGALRDFFGRRVRSRDEVDDLVQEAFARLVASRERRDVQFPAAYLFRIASNLIHDRGRRHARARLEEEIDADSAVFRVEPAQEDQRHLADLRAALDQVLAELSPRCRDVFVMRRFKNMTTPEIAGTLRISHRMVQKHMTRAMIAIHAALGDGRPFGDEGR